jgi:hypothetical protein
VCGTVTAKTYPFERYKYLRQVSFIIRGGDSGGTIFNHGQALGIAEGGRAKDLGGDKTADIPPSWFTQIGAIAGSTGFDGYSVYRKR